MQKCYLVEAPDSLETQRQQLLALSFTVNEGRPLITTAVSALVDDPFLGDALAHIARSRDTGQTDIGPCLTGHEGGPAQRAEH